MNIQSLLKTIPFLDSIIACARSKNVEIALVGGVLRDWHFRKKGAVKDVDFAVQKDAARIAAQFAKKSKGTLVTLDEDTRSYRVVVKYQGRIVHYDFTDWRAPTLREDMRKRDFTINTLSIALNTYPKVAIADPCHGLADLRKKILRAPADETFIEDPLRILRAFSLGSMFSCRIDTATHTKMVRAKALLKKVSAERISEEFFKLLRQKKAFPYIQQMSDTLILDEILPEIKKSRGCTQGEYHHLDVWKHTLLSLQKCEELFNRKKFPDDTKGYLLEEVSPQRPRYALIKFGCLLHDLGKPRAKKQKDGKTIFYAHEKYGRQITEKIAQRWKLSTKERQFLSTVVYWHLRPGCLVQDAYPTERAIYRFFRDAGTEGASIILLSIADWRATRGKLVDMKKRPGHERILFNLINDYFVLRHKKTIPPLVNGYDIMHAFHLEPSALIGSILAKVREEQLLGSIATKSEALKIAKQVIDNQKDTH